MADRPIPAVVMTIAGLDPSAGAGLLADIKTISAFGCYGVAAITSTTFQNTLGVYGAHHETRDGLLGQLAPLFDDFEIAAIKTGMLPTEGIILAVAETVSSHSIERVVVDPVVRSTSGFDLIDGRALDALVGRLFPLALLVTPNAAEVERITGIRIKDEATMERAARDILAMGPRAVLIKGGDMDGDTATDLLLDEQGAVSFAIKRVRSSSTHGTGCTLASAIACLIATGHALREAVPIAKRYVADAIRTAPRLGHGHGPVNHFFTGRARPVKRARIKLYSK